MLVSISNLLGEQTVTQSGSVTSRRRLSGETSAGLMLVIVRIAAWLMTHIVAFFSYSSCQCSKPDSGTSPKRVGGKFKFLGMGVCFIRAMSGFTGSGLGTSGVKLLPGTVGIVGPLHLGL
jgi:hypothetical protein